MDENRVVVVFECKNKNINVDLDIPLEISANDLVIALNKAYDLEIDTDNIKNCYMQCERPIALLKGNKTLREYGVRNGSLIICNR